MLAMAAPAMLGAASTGTASSLPQEAPAKPAAPMTRIAGETSDVSIVVTGLRSKRGQVLACLTARPKAFPDCDKDPDARHLIVPASEPLVLDFGEVPDGRYAAALIHDENSNGKLDTVMMIPREGFGFSRNARIRMGPPSFASAAFETAPVNTRLGIRVRYLL